MESRGGRMIIATFVNKAESNYAEGAFDDLAIDILRRLADYCIDNDILKGVSKDLQK